MIAARLQFAALALTIAAAGAGAAPAAAQDAGIAPAFDATGFARSAKPGRGRIDGSFIMRAANSGPLPRSGATIECYPALPYATWSLAASSTRDARLRRFARVTRTGADGDFHFARLPRGRYILRASLVTAFARIVRDPLQLAAHAVYDTSTPTTGGHVVYDYTRAWFQTDSVYVGVLPPPPPAFHLVARHDRFDPRR